MRCAKDERFLSDKTHLNRDCINSAQKFLDEDTKNKNFTKVTQEENSTSALLIC